MNIELTIEQKYIISFTFGLVNVSILISLMGRIEINECFILVGLVFLYDLFIFFNVKYLSSVFFKRANLEAFS